MEEDYPRAFCHEDEVEQRIMKHEQKYCTPLNDEEYREILASVHSDFEDCECSCCQSA